MLVMIQKMSKTPRDENGAPLVGGLFGVKKMNCWTVWSKIEDHRTFGTVGEGGLDCLVVVVIVILFCTRINI